MDKSVQFQREIIIKKKPNRRIIESDKCKRHAIGKILFKKENVVIQNGKLTIGTANRLWLFISLVMNFGLFFRIRSYLHMDAF